MDGGGEGGAGRCQRPGLQVGEVGCEGSQGVHAHALVDQMAQCRYILVGEQLGELVAALKRQDGGAGSRI